MPKTSVHRHLLWLAIAASIAGCAPPQPRMYTQPTVAQPSTITHRYSVIANDVNGKPMAGVTVSGTLKSEHTSSRSLSCTTNEEGRCPPFRYEVNRDPSLTYVTSYMSTATIEGTKDGYYTATGSGFSSYGSGSWSSDSSDIKLRLIRPVDYLQDNLATSSTDRELRDRVLRFLEIIRLQSILNDAEVMLKGIGTTEFKGKKYLQVKVNSTTSYNNLKLNKYDIGKRLFDDTVRKVLNPLNDAIAAPRAYYGYDVVVIGHSKNFAEKYATEDKHEFRFLMPETSVRRYKDKDISGQALLDASVILLNDERIDMKLQ